MIAAVRLRGDVDVSTKLSDTLDSLNLNKRNSCVLVDEDNDAAVGMLEQARNFITYGEVSEETLQKIEEKEGEAEPGTSLGLRPPSGGFKDTRKHVNAGGALGQREDMDELLQRML